MRISILTIPIFGSLMIISMDKNNNQFSTEEIKNQKLDMFIQQITQNGKYGCQSFEITQFKPKTNLGNLYYVLGFDKKKSDEHVHFISQFPLADNEWGRNYVSSILASIQKIEHEGETFITLVGPESTYLSLLENENESLYGQKAKKLLCRSQSLDNLPINYHLSKKQSIQSQSEKTESENSIEASNINLKITVDQTRERVECSQKTAFTKQTPSLTWAQRNTKKFAFLVGLTSCLSTLAAVKYWPIFASKAEPWHSEIYLYAKAGAASLLKYATSLLRK